MGTENSELKPKAALYGITPYIPGKSAEEVQKELGLPRVIKLASNENPLGPSPKAIEAVLTEASRLNIYPDSSSSQLRAKISGRLNVDEDMILVSNGADNIIGLLCQAFINPGDQVISSYPSFASYEIFSKTANGVFKAIPLIGWEHDLDGILGNIEPSTKMIIICNPNNPTGSYMSWRELRGFIQSVPKHILVVLDEAYGEFVDRSDAGESVNGTVQGLNMVVIRTFSKIYGLAGLRIGYAIAISEIIASIMKIKEAFSVNRLAEAAALAALDDYEHVEKTKNLTIKGRAHLKSELDALGLEVLPSQANFVWVRTGIDSHILFRELLKLGIIVRPGHIWNLPEYIRVSVGLPSEMEAFLKAMQGLNSMI